MRLAITLDGEQVIQARYEGVEWRALNLQGGWQAVFRMLEGVEEDFFDAIAPRLYDTGRLKRSLTRPGGDAIREAHRGDVRFGTRVPYAKFQTPRPIRVTPFIANASAGELMKWVMYGGESGRAYL